MNPDPTQSTNEYDCEREWKEVKDECVNGLKISESMSISRLIKYYYMIEMQFHVFEHMQNNVDLKDDVKYLNGDYEFKSNENDLLQIADTLKHILPVRDALAAHLDNKLTKEEFNEQWDQCHASYLRIYCK